MADVKVSALPELASGDLDPAADFLLVSDMSASASKKMKASEMIRVSLPYLSTYWDFTTGTLLPTVSFTRASTGWRYNSAGLLVSMAADAPRFQYDPVTLAARGLLIEDASTGLVTKSEQFDNVIWSKVRSSITPNTVVAPDGTTTGDSLIEDATAANTHDVRQAIAYVSGTTYAHTVFAKANTRSRIYMQFHASAFGTTKSVWFDLSGGTVGTTAAGVTAYIESVGSGWYRCVCIVTATGTSTQSWAVSLATADNFTAYDGDGASGLYLWGGNVRTDDVMTSYVSADASAVVRAADVALITNPQVLADQVYIIRARTPRKISGGAVNVLFQVDDGTSNNRRTIRYSTDGRLRVISVVGNSTQCDLDMGAVAAGTDFILAARFAENSFAASLNGGAIITDVSGSNPLGLTTARIGRGVSGTLWQSTIKTIESRRTASDAELPLLAA